VPKSILIVDDLATDRKTVRSFLDEFGFDICGGAVEGYDVIQQAEELKPDLILLDFAMPRMNGIEAAPILKKMLPNTPSAAPFALRRSARSRCTTNGHEAVVPKDGGLSMLLRCVETLMQAR
jgi:CheY-like chemotaxis protein